MALAKRTPAAKKTARGAAAKPAKRGPGRPRATANKAAAAKRGPGRPRRTEAPVRKTRQKAQPAARTRTSRKEKVASTRVNPSEIRSQATSLVLNTVIQLKAETVERHDDYMVVNGLIIPNSSIIAVLNDETVVYRSSIDLGKITEIGTVKKMNKKRVVTDTSTVIIFDETPFQIMSGTSAAEASEEEEEAEEMDDEAADDDIEEDDDTEGEDDDAEDDDEDEAEEDDDDLAEDDDDIAADDDDEEEPAPRGRRKSNVFEDDDDDI